MAEDFGGNLLERLSEFRYNGTLIRVNNLAAASHQWQNPWHLVHRVALHDSLKKAATQDEGAGCPANLHTSSKVVDVDPERGIITLEDGTTVVAHVIVGADGIYVSLPGYQIKGARLMPSNQMLSHALDGSSAARTRSFSAQEKLLFGFSFRERLLSRTPIHDKSLPLVTLPRCGSQMIDVLLYILSMTTR